MTTMQTSAAGDVAAALDLIADQVEQDPRHVLDVMGDVLRGVPEPERDVLVGSVYGALTEYLSVGRLDHWGASRTSDEVAAKLRACARTTRRGGPTHVDAVPPTTDPADAALVERAEAASRQTANGRTFTPAAALRVERGQVLSRLIRMRRAAHPNSGKITDAELRLVEIDRELADMGEEPPSGDDVARNDAEALALIDQSQSFPRDRDPAGSWSGL